MGPLRLVAKDSKSFLNVFFNLSFIYDKALKWERRLKKYVSVTSIKSLLLTLQPSLGASCLSIEYFWCSVYRQLVANYNLYDDPVLFDFWNFSSDRFFFSLSHLPVIYIRKMIIKTRHWQRIRKPCSCSQLKLHFVVVHLHSFFSSPAWDLKSCLFASSVKTWPRFPSLQLHLHNAEITHLHQPAWIYLSGPLGHPPTHAVKMAADNWNIWKEEGDKETREESQGCVFGSSSLPSPLLERDLSSFLVSGIFIRERQMDLASPRIRTQSNTNSGKHVVYRHTHTHAHEYI